MLAFFSLICSVASFAGTAIYVLLKLINTSSIDFILAGGLAIAGVLFAVVASLSSVKEDLTRRLVDCENKLANMQAEKEEQERVEKEREKEGKLYE